MAETKQVRNIRAENSLRAIQSQAGFVSFVVGKVKKVGIAKVLQQYQPALGQPTEFHWLKKAYERVLDFAEQAQLKQIPTESKLKIEGEIDHYHKLADQDLNRIEAEILEGSLYRQAASEN